jgi:ATP-dependent DNA ligase
VVGWTDPEGRRPYLGGLLLAYYDPDGRLVYAGRVGTGINQAELERLWRRLQPLANDKMPLEVPPPRTNRFGSPLVLSRVHWVRPELVAEVNTSHGLTTTCCGRWSTRVCARTSRRPRFAGRCHIRNPPRRTGPLLAHDIGEADLCRRDLESNLNLCPVLT